MSTQQLDIARRQLEIDQLDIDRRQLEIENTQLTKRQLPEWWAKFWSSHPRSNKDCESAVAVEKKSKKRSVERERWSHEQGYQKGYTAGLEKASKKIDVLADAGHLHACELSIVLLLLVLNVVLLLLVLNVVVQLGR
jgi:flagellar biosynthesis/type III secretory pathway protein FliH